ncbi:uncharacterized protein BX663DRAFT_558776 [Cokeromyces recurvatus]|uniref:uncharacterized protein n=1 Tax=Cokeromyces recurvatus TaxID=90255 RepID=UPI002220F49C|nr:uncharacterized protein BX663DRAFT_558776 [Cokeromyces recurvatus]KAI7906243.1 hypothetical protein BX663DRAFT_558776 [Cokeromyces recurvatus]
MARSIIFVSALLAMVAYVAAAPHGSSSEENNVQIKKNGAHVIDIPDLEIVDVINNIPIIAEANDKHFVKGDPVTIVKGDLLQSKIENWKF